MSKKIREAIKAKLIEMGSHVGKLRLSVFFILVENCVFKIYEENVMCSNLPRSNSSSNI